MIKFWKQNNKKKEKKSLCAVVNIIFRFGSTSIRRKLAHDLAKSANFQLDARTWKTGGRAHTYFEKITLSQKRQWQRINLHQMVRSFTFLLLEYNHSFTTETQNLSISHFCHIRYDVFHTMILRSLSSKDVFRSGRVLMRLWLMSDVIYLDKPTM